MSEAAVMATEKQAVPQGYKQTEVGVIPEDWIVAPLEDFTSFISYGFTNPMPTVDDGPVMVTARDIADGRIQYDSARRTSLFAFNQYLTPKSKPKKDDLLLTKDGTLGRVALVDKDNICINQSVALIRPNNKINPSFFKLLLESPFYQGTMLENAGGSTIKHIYITIVNRMPIGIPENKKEQTAIANALSDMDALLTELEQLIAKKQAIKTATMQQLLTGKTRLPQFATHTDGEHKGQPKGMKPSELGEIPEDWDVVDFGTIATPSSSRINPQIKGGGEPCIELEHINSRKGSINGHTTTSDSSSIKSVFSKHDVLFGKLRSYLRKFWLSDMDGVCSTEIWVLKANNELVIPVFLYQLVQMDSFISCTSEAYGTHMPRADWSVVKSHQISLPSIEEQTAIANILSDMDAEIQALEQRLAKTRQIKQGMMQELLTGKTRLPFDVTSKG